MKKIWLLLPLAGLLACQQPEQAQNSDFGIIVHGGAGTILKENMTPEMERAYTEKLQEALQTGWAILEKGGSSLDAVEAAVMLMEDSPLFNAGKGAVFTSEGKNEMDACIMDGNTLNSGAVAGITNIKNPVHLARLVMERSKHVMFAAGGAVAFAREQGMEFADDDYFFTQRRWDGLQKALQKENKDKQSALPSDHKFGTVGACALDKNGNLAAATSTGGMTNKKYGRIGDSPIVGAGNYANNKTCAVSGTGHGEYFIRGVVAYDISAQMQYGGVSLQQAAETVVMQKLTELGGTGGIIAIDNKGNVAMPFNTAGMYRGYMLNDGKLFVKIYKN